MSPCTRTRVHTEHTPRHTRSLANPDLRSASPKGSSPAGCHEHSLRSTCTWRPEGSAPNDPGGFLPNRVGGFQLPQKDISEMLTDAKGARGLALHNPVLCTTHASFHNGYKWENSSLYRIFFSIGTQLRFFRRRQNRGSLPLSLHHQCRQPDSGYPISQIGRDSQLGASFPLMPLKFLPSPPDRGIP